MKILAIGNYSLYLYTYAAFINGVGTYKHLEDLGDDDISLGPHLPTYNI